MVKKVKIKAEKDPNSLFYKRKVRVGGYKFETPIKAIDLTKIQYDLPQEIRGLNYIFKRVGEKKKVGQTWIDDLKFNPKKDQIFTYNINTAKNKALDTDVNMLFMEYDGDKYPRDEDLKFIADKIHANSIIVPMPLITNLRKKITEGQLKEFDKYMDFIKACYARMNTLNDRPIMGMIPVLTPTYTGIITNYYLDKGVNTFCIDFDGRSPSSTSDNVLAMLKTINDYDGDIDDVFITSINTNPGRAGKNADVIFSKDIISYGFGIDSFGDKHKRIAFKPTPPPPMPKSQLQELNKFRLFSKLDYGYYKVNFKALKAIYPQDSVIPINDLISGVKDKKDNKLQNAFNIEQQGLESLALRKHVEDQDTRKYIGKKDYVKDEDIKKMDKVQGQLKTNKRSSLFDI